MSRRIYPKYMNWVFVGTAGADGVDALLTSESPAFQNGWTNLLDKRR